MARHLILLVDPDLDARTILSAYLEHLGYATVAAATAREGYDLARSLGPRLIIGEHPLPLEDGRPLCDALAELPETAATPFLALTVHGGGVATAVRVRPAGVLIKPTSLRRLTHCVERLLGQPA